MANFKYNPPTRDFCQTCVDIAGSFGQPAIDTYSGQASSADNSPLHNWFYFVLGYSPAFPEYIFGRENINPSHVIADPFMGTGTTLVSASQNGIESLGIDANDFFIRVAEIKSSRFEDLLIISQDISLFLKELELKLSKYHNKTTEGSLFFENYDDLESLEEYSQKYRPLMMDSRYICDVPFAKLHIAKDLCEKFTFQCEKSQDLIWLSINSLILPSSNVRYGPGFGVSKKQKTDINITKMLQDKLSRMIQDISLSNKGAAPSRIFHGDSRNMDEYLAFSSIDYMITSPPYPGDHEYTKHTRLELIFNGIANDKMSFRKIKKRMLVSSTTNIYKEDQDRKIVENIESIKEVVQMIDERLKLDGATSGFEKLYSRLVLEYFGGMARTLRSALKVLKPGGKFILLVSDSHAFKMVHIRTASILAEIALQEGYTIAEIELWQNKVSTSHSYNIPEEILTITK
jgi:DNA modification methylase